MLPYQFAAVTTAQGAWLDTNFLNTGVCTVIPCSSSGTNTLVLASATGMPFSNAYTFDQAFSYVSTTNNTGPCTAAVDALPALNVYKDTPEGPTALVGGELVAGNMVILRYDITLNSGAGGFHIETGGQIGFGATGTANTVNSGSGASLSAAQVTGDSSGFGVIQRTGAPGGGFNDQMPTATAIIAALIQPMVGTKFDFMVINATGQTQTITTNTGITLVGLMTTAASAVGHRFTGIVTNVGTPAVSIYG